MKRFLALCVGLCILAGVGHREALGQKKDAPVSVPKLEEIPGVMKDLQNKDAKKRATAAARLGARGELRAKDVKEAIEPLAELVEKDEEASVRLAAANALAKCDPDPKLVLESLLGALKNDKDIGVRTAAATALGRLGPAAKEAISALQEAVAIGKEAGKDDRAKQALGQAATNALTQIRGKGKK